LNFNHLNYASNEEFDQPVTPNLSIESLFDIVNEIPARRSNSIFKKDTIKFDQIANTLAVSNDGSTTGSLEYRFMDLFHKTMNQIVKERY
jgi:hypothetical protein